MSSLRQRCAFLFCWEWRPSFFILTISLGTLSTSERIVGRVMFLMMKKALPYSTFRCWFVFQLMCCLGVVVDQWWMLFSQVAFDLVCLCLNCIVAGYLSRIWISFQHELIESKVSLNWFIWLWFFLSFASEFKLLLNYCIWNSMIIGIIGSKHYSLKPTWKLVWSWIWIHFWNLS